MTPERMIKLQKRVYSVANDRKRFGSTCEELLEHILVGLWTTGYLSDGIGETPLRQMLDSLICTAVKVLRSFDADEFGSSDTYGEQMYQLNENLYNILKVFEDQLKETESK